MEGLILRHAFHKMRPILTTPFSVYHIYRRTIMESTERQTDNQTTSQTWQSNEDPHEQISRRAYELYLERGEHSDANQNWLDAEKEILGESVQPAPEQAQAASVGQES
jgi:hypothetical protein